MGPMGNITFTWSVFLHIYVFLIIKLHYILGEDMCSFWTILDLFQIQNQQTSVPYSHCSIIILSVSYSALIWPPLIILVWSGCCNKTTTDGLAYKQHVLITHNSVHWNVLDQDAGIFSEALLPYRRMAPPLIPQSTFIKMFIYSSIFLGQGYTTQPSFAWNLLWNIGWPLKLMSLLPWPS